MTHSLQMEAAVGVVVVIVVAVAAGVLVLLLRRRSSGDEAAPSEQESPLALPAAAPKQAAPTRMAHAAPPPVPAEARIAPPPAAAIAQAASSQALIPSAAEPPRLRLLGLVLGLLVEQTRGDAPPPQLGTAIARLADGDEDAARSRLSTLALTLMGEDQASKDGEEQLASFLNGVLEGELSHGLSFSSMPEFQQALGAVSSDLRRKLDTIVWSRNADSVNILTPEDIQALEQVAVAMATALVIDTSYRRRLPGEEEAAVPAPEEGKADEVEAAEKPPGAEPAVEEVATATDDKVEEPSDKVEAAPEEEAETAAADDAETEKLDEAPAEVEAKTGEAGEATDEAATEVTAGEGELGKTDETLDAAEPETDVEAKAEAPADPPETKAEPAFEAPEAKASEAGATDEVPPEGKAEAKPETESPVEAEPGDGRTGEGEPAAAKGPEQTTGDGQEGQAQDATPAGTRAGDAKSEDERQE